MMEEVQRSGITKFRVYITFVCLHCTYRQDIALESWGELRATCPMCGRVNVVTVKPPLHRTLDKEEG